MEGYYGNTWFVLSSCMYRLSGGVCGHLVQISARGGIGLHLVEGIKRTGNLRIQSQTLSWSHQQ